MKQAHHSIRLSQPLDRVLRNLAERHGVGHYAMLQRCVKAGLAALTDAPDPDAGNRELVTELAALSVRMTEVERLLDRALFTACAAYAYSRSAALAARASDEAITEEIHKAYERQRLLARETKP
ncbi:hypothetical protein [Stakelama pacifica]|uniref:Uncharacterized protein n=1 Tax=Stakelama pacifica TaxID=517720 RepID=A0A4R6FXF6_9SPHN|nr:hypothetical protein [Stakelama pacifica]TDN86477.1 hypothetical protein EV664_10146 [Stakelama pacifica]GGO89766.1 hypothetical protein GCM10011329_00480 [Stakelama pacifica]